MNHISVSRNVGNLNVGQQIGDVNAAVNFLGADPSTEAPGMADALKTVTEAVHSAPDLGDVEKKEAIDLLAEIAKAVQAPPEQRSTRVLTSLVGGLAPALSGANALSDLWTKYEPAVRAYLELRPSVADTPLPLEPA